MRHWHWLPWWRRIQVLIDDHPFEIGLSAALILFGLRAGLNFNAVPAAVHSLPFWLIVTYCGLSVVGGSSVLVGLICKYRISWMSGLEKAGLWISGSAWASYAIGLLLGPFTARAFLLELALTALVWASLMRVRAITRRDSARRQALDDYLKRHTDEESEAS